MTVIAIFQAPPADSPTQQEPFGFLQGALRNPSKRGTTDSAPLPQGAFLQAETLDRKDKAALPPLGNSSFMFTARPDTGFSNLLPSGMSSPIFTGVSGQGDPSLQRHHGQMSHQPYGGNHPSAKGTTCSDPWTPTPWIREGDPKIRLLLEQPAL